MDCAWLCEVAGVEQTEDVSERPVNDLSDGIGIGFRCRVGFHSLPTSISERASGRGCGVHNHSTNEVCRNCISATSEGVVVGKVVWL